MWSFLRTLGRTADAYDRSPVSLPQLGQRIWKAGLDRAERTGLQDPEHARIEALRHDPDRPGSVIFLDSELGLGLPEDEYQSQLRQRHTPAWARAGLTVSRVRLGSVLARVADRRERARRGWSRTDAWSAHRHLAAVAAGMLTQLAREGMSWPGESEEFPNPQVWHDALERHAAALARYSGPDPERDDALSRWCSLATDPQTAHTDAEQSARDRADELERIRLGQAQEAMRWIAEHFPDLWD